MRLTCSQQDLQKAVQSAARAISPRTSLPILSHLLVSATQTATITGTDLELAIQSRLEGTVHEPGALALPGRLLAEIAAQLPAGPVELSVARDTLTARITGPSVTFELPGLPVADFPAIVEQSATAPLAAVAAPTLRALIRSTVFAASTDEARPFLTGVYVAMRDGVAEFVATDGGRLARRTTSLATTQPLGEIVPAHSMAELARLLGQTDAQVSIGTFERQLVFSLSEVRLVTRVIAGRFPAYENVIPKEFKQSLTLDTGAFADALRRAHITARDTAHTVRLATSNGTLVVKSNTHDVGASEERVPVETSGDAIDIAFNGLFLLEALQAIEATKTTLRLTGPLTPGVLAPADDNGFTYVLAPVRVYG